MEKDLNTYCVNTWCPGCGDFTILTALKQALLEIDTQLSDFVVVSGIGCHAKIVDYINVNTFYSLHGRAVPAAEGIKIANPKLKVIVFCGDGDVYGEGLEHLMFAAKRNIDITLVVHNNRLYSLTTGQVSPTSPKGFVGKSTPYGSVEKPFNPLELTYSAGATFIARSYTKNLNQIKDLIKKGINHQGFAHIDVLQICATFFDNHDYYDKNVYELKNHQYKNKKQAYKKITEWDYNSEAKIGLGLLYQKKDYHYDKQFSKKFNTQKKESKIIQFIKKTSN